MSFVTIASPEPCHKLEKLEVMMYYSNIHEFDHIHILLDYDFFILYMICSLFCIINKDHLLYGLQTKIIEKNKLNKKARTAFISNVE